MNVLCLNLRSIILRLLKTAVNLYEKKGVNLAPFFLALHYSSPCIIALLNLFQV